MRQNSTANLRALVAAVVVVTFVVISSYISFGIGDAGSPKISNQNEVSTSLTQVVTTQNTTTYSFATATATQTTIISTPKLTNITTEAIPPAGLYFGNQWFEPPSAILIPANTLVWTNFRLDGITNDTNVGIHAGFILLPFPSAIGANITVAIYLNGVLNVNSTTPVFNHAADGINSSMIPSSSPSNSIFALTGVTPTLGMDTQTSTRLNVLGSTISVAFFSDRSIWLSGWSPKDMSSGSGPQFGQSAGQLANTFEVPETGINILPNSLPHGTTTLQFELQIPGELIQ